MSKTIMDAIVADLKTKLKNQGWTLCESQMPDSNKRVEIVLSSGHGERAYIENEKWINANSGYTIYTDVIAWREIHALTSFVGVPFPPFKRGDSSATIGYWKGQGDNTEFVIVTTINNHSGTYSPSVFYSMVITTVRHLKDAYHANLSLDVYSRQDAPNSLNTEGDSL